MIYRCNKCFQTNRYDLNVWFGRNSIGGSSLINPCFQIKIAERSWKGQWAWNSSWRHSIWILPCWCHIMTSIFNSFVFTFWIGFMFDGFENCNIFLVRVFLHSVGYTMDNSDSGSMHPSEIWTNQIELQVSIWKPALVRMVFESPIFKTMLKYILYYSTIKH